MTWCFPSVRSLEATLTNTFTLVTVTSPLLLFEMNPCYQSDCSEHRTRIGRLTVISTDPTLCQITSQVLSKQGWTCDCSLSSESVPQQFSQLCGSAQVLLRPPQPIQHGTVQTHTAHLFFSNTHTATANLTTQMATLH